MTPILTDVVGVPATITKRDQLTGVAVYDPPFLGGAGVGAGVGAIPFKWVESRGRYEPASGDPAQFRLPVARADVEGVPAYDGRLLVELTWIDEQGVRQTAELELLAEANAQGVLNLTETQRPIQFTAFPDLLAAMQEVKGGRVTLDGAEAARLALLDAAEGFATLTAQVDPALAEVATATAEALGAAGVNPAYIYDATQTPGAAPDGTMGAQFAADGTFQRIKRTGATWVPQGTPLITQQGLERRTSVNVLDYGAKGDGVTDDRLAVIAAITAAKVKADGGQRVVLHFPHCAGYAVAAGVAVNHTRIAPWMDAPLIYTGTATQHTTILRLGLTAAEVAAQGAAQGKTPSQSYPLGQMDNLRCRLWAVRQTVGDWAAGTELSDPATMDVGILVINANHCDIKFESTYGSTVGVRAHGDRWGVAYNTFTMGSHIAHKSHAEGLATKVGSDYGWVNENTWIGGHFASLSILGSRSRIGFRFWHDQDVYFCNNNRFIGPCFELKDASLAGGVTATAFDLLNATLNTVTGARYEGGAYTGAPYTLVTERGATSFNRYEFSYVDKAGVIDDTACTIRNGMLQIRGAIGTQVSMNPYGRVIWRSGRLVDAATVSGGNLSLGSVAHLASGSGGAAVNSLAGLTLNAETITLPAAGNGGVGVFIDTRRAKRFGVRINTRNGTVGGAPGTGRLAVKPLDATNAVIDGSATTLIFGESTTTFTWSTVWGGAFRTQSDGLGPVIPFTVAAGVDHVQVIVAGANLDLSSIELICYDAAPTHVWSGVTANAASSPTMMRVFDSGFLGQKSAAYDATKTHIQGQSFMDYTTGTVSLAGASVAVFPDHIEVSAAAASFTGVFVDTSVVKTLTIRRTVLNGRGGRLKVMCFDGAGAFLTGGADLTATGGGVTYTASTKTYGEGTDQTADNTITVSAATQKVYVMLVGGSNPNQLVSWVIDALGPTRVWSGVEQLTPRPGRNYATQAPVHGTYIAGAETDQVAPAAGGKRGFVCVAAGTPGTWKAWGAIDA